MTTTASWGDDAHIAHARSLQNGELAEEVSRVRLNVDPATSTAFDELPPDDWEPDEPQDWRVDAPGVTGPPQDSSGRYVKLRKASTITVDRPSWVWDLRIPIGGTTLMPGIEGTGKTLLAVWLASQLTRGKLPGKFHGKPTDVVYIGHEDDYATVLVPRLVAAGCDLDRFHFIAMPPGAHFSAAVDTDALADTIEAEGLTLALLIIDPMDSHLGSIDTHRKSEVQTAIGQIAAMTQRLRCGALGLGHFNKGAGATVLAKVVGSVGFTTSVRSVLAVGEHPDDPAQRVCAVSKANMTDKSSVPAVQFTPTKKLIPHHDGGVIDTGVAVIGEEITGFDPNSILVSDPQERDALHTAKTWLEAMVASGGVAKAELVKLARAEGIAERTLQRARVALGLVVTTDEHARGRPSTWHPADYVPEVPCQTPMAHKPQVSDQGKRAPEGGSVPLPMNGTKPVCGRCGADAERTVRQIGTDLELCPACCQEVAG